MLSEDDIGDQSHSESLSISNAVCTYSEDTHESNSQSEHNTLTEGTQTEGEDRKAFIWTRFSNFTYLKSFLKELYRSPKSTVSKIQRKKWNPFEAHKFMSQIIFLFSLILFILYKFFWRGLVERLTKQKDKSSIDDESILYDISQDHFSIFSLLWWMRYAAK